MIEQESGPPSAIDPVCGMSVNPSKAAGNYEYRGETYYFCGLGCAEKFRAHPDSYLKPKEPAPIAVAATTRGGQVGGQVEYTCPMHPDVRQMGPGSCPKCGMALEPREATGEEINPELVDMTRRFRIGLVLTIPVFFLEMGSHIPVLGLYHLVSARTSSWISRNPARSGDSITRSRSKVVELSHPLSLPCW